nr:15 kDa excretory/secretory protein [Haemonchus contortus]
MLRSRQNTDTIIYKYQHSREKFAAFTMFFILAALISFHVCVAAQGSKKPLPEESKDTFETLNMLYSDNLEWSDDWAKKALEYLKSKDSVKADMVIKGKKSFPVDDKQLLWQKVLAFLEPRFDKKEKALKRLPAGTVYGCNGFINRKGNKDIISAACLYNKP